MQRDIDEVEVLLIKWAEAMRVPGKSAEGYPEKASGGFIDSWIKDSDELLESADDSQIGKTKAAIDSLSRPHYRIIHKKHCVSYMVWSFPNEDALYLAAKAAFKTLYFAKRK